MFSPMMLHMMHRSERLPRRTDASVCRLAIAAADRTVASVLLLEETAWPIEPVAPPVQQAVSAG